MKREDQPPETNDGFAWGEQESTCGSANVICQVWISPAAVEMTYAERMYG